MSNKRSETRIEEDGDGGVNIGIDADYGFSASISSSGVLSLGIGIAEVEYNLKDPNESTISYVFGLYEIEGERRGCTVILHYKIAGVETHTETRIIPDCEDPDPPEPEPEPDPGDEPKDPKRPKGNSYDFVAQAFCRPGRIIGKYVSGNGSVETTYREYDITTSFDNFRWEGRTGAFDIDTMNTGYRYSYLLRTPEDSDYENINTTRIYPYETINRNMTDFDIGSRGYYDASDDNFFANDIMIFNIAAFVVRGLRWQVDDFISRLNKRTKTYIVINHPNTRVYINDQWQEYPNYTYDKEELKFLEELIIEKADIPTGTLPPFKTPEAKMDKQCCQLIEEIHEALDVEELLSNGLTVPNRMISPGGKSSTKLKNYLEIQEWQFRQTDLVGIYPFTASIKDSNEAVEGDQGLSMQFPNATAALKFITETVMEAKGDSATRLNLLVRISFLLVEITSICVQGARAAKALASYFGMPIMERVEKVKVPFDVTLGAFKSKSGQGFAKPQSGEAAKKAILDKMNKNSEDATEDMLPDFMQVSELEVKTQDFRPSTEFNFWEFLKRTLRID